MASVKAVISTAGFGTRLFPVTAAVNKSLLPVGNRPVIDYLLTELVAAGVQEIAFVTLPGDDAIRRYVEPQEWVREYFESRGWQRKYEPVSLVHQRFADIRFTWIEQPLDGRYGTAIPPMLARDFVGDSDWLLVTGDDVVLRADGGSDIADLVAAAADASAAVQVTEVPHQQVSRYGIIRTRSSDSRLWLDGAIEKPSPEEAPSNLASISRFFLRSDFFGYLDALEADPKTDEYYSFSALIAYAAEHPVLVHTIRGTYYDCGNADGWLDANLAVMGRT